MAKPNRQGNLLQEFSPPANPTRQEQADALRKGLGRATLWAQSGRLSDELLLEACLHDQRFDPQVDSCRGQWLWQLLSLTNSTENHREAILSSLRSISEEREAPQLCQLALCYGQAADRQFVEELYEFVDRTPFPDSPWLGVEELLQIDNETAFQFLARRRGAQLASSDWEWHDDLLLERALNQLGTRTVNRILRNSEDADVVRYRQKQPETTRLSKTDSETASREWAKRLDSFSVSDAITAARSGGPVFWMRGWGLHTTDECLDLFLEQLWVEEEPAAIINMLRAFSARPLPKFDSRLIDLCRRGDADVRRWAMTALRQNSDPRIREFALSELETSNDDYHVVQLFEKNLEPGDEQRLLKTVILPEEPDERHSIMMAFVRLLEQNPKSEVKDLALSAYFHSPCQECRRDASRLLIQRSAAPTWLIKECRHDADEGCRSLV